jgi:hypothetical protein
MTTDYPFIRYLGRRLGSHKWYIDDQIEQARGEGAPQTAASRRARPRGGWTTINDYTNVDSLRGMLVMAEDENNAEAAMLLRVRIADLTAPSTSTAVLWAAKLTDSALANHLRRLSGDVGAFKGEQRAVLLLQAAERLERPTVTDALRERVHEGDNA